MQPIHINLKVKVNLWRRLVFVVIILVTCATGALTFVNTFDYYGNTKVIKDYEKRVQQLEQRSKRQASNREETLARKRMSDQTRKDKNLIVPMIEKALFPVTDVLTRIEQTRPDKVHIESLKFGKDMKSVQIIGRSLSFNAVSAFISQLADSKYFEVTLNREEVIEQTLIEFELYAKWTGVGI